MEISTRNQRHQTDTFDKTSCKVAVAGHICLDIIPSFGSEKRDFENLLIPGKLIVVGQATIATGGAVGNVGLALHRLGVPTVLIAKIGRDPFGDLIKDLLNHHSPELTKAVIVDEESSTSYTLVINPTDRDRLFLHSPGANDEFKTTDISDSDLDGVGLFHFGYPPLMRQMYRNDGRELEKLLAKVKGKGIATSLDMAKPDPESEAGKVDWISVLERILPYVDIFQPSLDEIFFMIDREQYDFFKTRYGEDRYLKFINTDLLDQLSQTLIEMGAGVVVIKLGEQGLFLRTAKQVEALEGIIKKNAALPKWSKRQLLAPCFRADVIGTTGSGDCAIAGFLAGVLDGADPIGALTMALGVGAFSTEKLDATSGVERQAAVQRRIAGGWKRREVCIEKTGWQWLDGESIWQGPMDEIGKAKGIAH
jgi:sugar/nucleoside kinase (ribokinase family)